MIMSALGEYGGPTKDYWRTMGDYGGTGRTTGDHGSYAARSWDLIYKLPVPLSFLPRQPCRFPKRGKEHAGCEVHDVECPLIEEVRWASGPRVRLGGPVHHHGPGHRDGDAKLQQVQDRGHGLGVLEQGHLHRDLQEDNHYLRRRGRLDAREGERCEGMEGEIERASECMNDWVDEWADECVDEWADGWVDGWVVIREFVSS